MTDALEQWKKTYGVKYALPPDADTSKSVLGAKMLIADPEKEGLRAQFPMVSGALKGAMGTAPDEIGGSVLDPTTARERQGAEIGFGVNTALQTAPLVGPILRGVRGVAGAALGGPAAGSRAAQRGAVGVGEQAPRSLNSVLENEPYSLKSIEALAERSGSRGMIPTQDIRAELNRPGISKAEKDVLAPYAAQETGAVKAEDLVGGFKSATKDYTLKPYNHDEYADYGLGRIGRSGSRDALEAKDTAKTTTWRLPKNVSGSVGNHFKDPDYFGHTRTFEEGGIPHVVEIQSDLMQKTKLEGPKRQAAEADLAQLQESLIFVADKTKEKNDRLFRVGRSIERVGERNAILAEYSQLPSIQSVQLKISELESKLASGVTAKDLTPMKKTHQERLVKEQLNMAAKAGKDRVRFADPDTVAKVEGWPEPRTATETRIRINLEDLATLESEAARTGKVDSRGVQTLKDLIDHDREILSNLGPERFKKEHQGIYDNYKELETYLKKIGGTPYTDKNGHGWIEVPTKGPQSPVKQGRVPLFSMTGAPIATGAGAGYNAQQPEPAK